LGNFDLCRHFLEPEFQLGRTPGVSLDPGLVGVTLRRIGSMKATLFCDAATLFRDVATFERQGTRNERRSSKRRWNGKRLYSGIALSESLRFN
jgi:hypothetical protein